jgi:lipid-A-disaccharide synthase
MKLFFIVGEDSGDALAAPVISELQKNSVDDIECMGIGGPLMEAEGFKTLLPMNQISVVGIWEVLPKLLHLFKIKKAIIEEIELGQPDAVITVDFPDFNFFIAETLRKRDVYKGKIIHYVAPSVWAWRPKRAQKIAQFLDGIMCLFPMEPEYFIKHKLKAEHVGHPLVVSGAKSATGKLFRTENRIPDDAKTLGLFFGSRGSEFKNLSSIIKNAAMLVDDVEDELHIIAPTLPRLEYDVQHILKDFKLPVYVISNPLMKWEAMKACDVAIAVSGTVGLELAYAGVPHIICYKVNPITALIIKTLVKIKHVHLANILLDKEVVPELLQGACVPETIAQKAEDLLRNDELRNKQLEEFKELNTKLGHKEKQTPSQKAAAFIIETIKGR